MSQYKNVTGGALSLAVDGVTQAVKPGGVVTVGDEFDYQIEGQPSWELVKGKATAPAVEKPAEAETEGDK